MLKILLKFKDSEIKTIETDKAEITIGRNPTNDIHIDNLGVSKQHAKIIRQDEAYVIEDLNSTNGTFIRTAEGQEIFLRREEFTVFGSGYISLGKKVDLSDENVIHFLCE